MNTLAQQNIKLNKKSTEYTFLDNILVFFLTTISILISFFINNIVSIYLENKTRKERLYVYMFSVLAIFIILSLFIYYLKAKVS